MENCSSYFHIKQDINENPFEANREFTIKQIITYLSILQAISGSERKTFQSKNLTFTNFYIFVTKTNALHFRFEGGCGGSHWDICSSHFSHFSDTWDDTLIIHLFLFSSFIPLWECPHWKPFFLLRQVNFLYSWGGHSIHLGWRGLTVWGNRLVLYLELEKELTVLTYDNDLCCVDFTWISNPIKWLCNLQKKILSLITYYSKGCRSVAIPSGHSYFWLL